MTFNNIDIDNLTLEQEQRIVKVQNSIDYLFSLFEKVGQQLFPRKMAAGERFGIVVNSKEQVLYECIKANFVDCRISAYTNVIDADLDAGLVPSNVVFIDIDRKQFSNREEFSQTVQNTKNKIKQVLGINPVVIATGGGVHIVILLQTRPLIYIEELKNKIKEPSREFLKFAESWFSNGKNDSHQPNSFRNYLLRIPNTFNGKKEDKQEVILLESNIEVASLNKTILSEYNLYLAEQIRVKQQKKQRPFVNNTVKRKVKFSTLKELLEKTSGYEYVEKLYNSTIEDNRYFCVWVIFARYFTKVKGMNEEQAKEKVRDWLIRCNEVKQVEKLETKLYAGFNTLDDKYPPRLETLKKWNEEYHGKYDNILEVIS
jgi:hypothetical protein